ncbi:MAG: peptidoglycan endopeptidase, partial [Thermoplasmata archaeon]
AAAAAAGAVLLGALLLGRRRGRSGPPFAGPDSARPTGAATPAPGSGGATGDRPDSWGRPAPPGTEEADDGIGPATADLR